jgi:AbrB family looped-hinge helix DNA binding protein
MLEAALTKVGEKGRLVIPAKFREALGIKPGDVVRLEIVNGELKVSTFASRLKRAQERVQRYTTPGKSLVDELIAERREEARRDEQEHQESKKLTMRKHG